MIHFNDPRQQKLNDTRNDVFPHETSQK